MINETLLDITVIFLILYFVCSQAIYIAHVKKYMDLEGIENMNEQKDNFHQFYGNQLWMACLMYWWDREERVNYLKTAIKNYKSQP